MSTAASSSLEERLARREAAEEARGLIAAYARAIDALDTESLRPLFAHDIVVRFGDTVLNGLDAVLEGYQAYWSATGAARRHFITNVAINNLTPSEAEATSYFLFVAAAGGIPSIGWGTYRDTFRRQTDGSSFSPLRTSTSRLG